MAREGQFHKQPTLVEPKIITPSLQIPSQIGPFKIESILSKGKISLLYLGIHPHTKEPIAVKVLSGQYAQNRAISQQFLDEAKLISLNNHPNIVKLYDQGTWEGGLYIAMEFIRGISLRQFIEQNSLSRKKSIEILLQVAHALAHFHSNQIIHGDLKPENILITETGMIKVIDFGIARLYQDDKTPLYIQGTPTYMSPEQKEKPEAVSFSSDIYALGIIAYELFTGKLSFGIIHLSQIPQGLRPILEKALAVSSQERYFNVLDLISDISYYLQTGGLEKDKPSLEQVKEILESLQESALSLSKPTIEASPYYEAAISRISVLGQPPLYFDVFHLPDHVDGFILARPVEKGCEAVTYLGVLRGVITALLSAYTDFKLEKFLSDLTHIFQTDSLQNKYELTLVTINPYLHHLELVSFGNLASVFHLDPVRKKVHKLSHTHPVLGSLTHQYWQMTSYEWKVGDMIIFHTFPVESDEMAKKILGKIFLQSSHSQASYLIKKIPPSLKEKTAHLVLSIHRIG